MLADELDYVVGVDTHRDSHALAVVAASSGGVVVVEPSLSACPEGYRGLLELAQTHAAGVRAFAVEGTGSYGAGLTRFLVERGERVLEVERPSRSRGRRGKSDVLDAVRAARGVLGEDGPAQPRAGGQRACLQALLRTREGALRARRAGWCQLRALIVTCPTGLREQLRALTPARLLKRCANLRPGGSLEQRGTRLALRLLARRIQLLTIEERALKREISALVERLAPQLLAEPGVGPISAAQVIVAWSHPGRLRSEACFARLGGAPPIPASSARRSATASTAAATANSTEPCTRSSSTAASATKRRTPTSTGASAKAKPSAKRSAASNASSPAGSSDYSRPRHRTLDTHRSIPGSYKCVTQLRQDTHAPRERFEAIRRRCELRSRRPERLSEIGAARLRDAAAPAALFSYPRKVNHGARSAPDFTRLRRP
jgi:transposase